MKHPAQLYLADQRGHSETALVRSFHVFNTGTYQAADREPFGSLYLLDDDTLRAGASLKRRVETDTAVVLFPITGGLEYATDAAPDFLEPGQTQTLWLPAGASYTVSNPYETETINVLQFGFSGQSATVPPDNGLTKFNIIHQNKLLPLFSLPGVSGLIGRYDGRAKDEFTATGNVFVFVLKGGFEVANRLVHERDGLALPAQQEGVIEFEALSNDAVLILMQV